MGSVKTNLGHGEAASAISSLIKTVLCLENGQIPATLGIKRLNPALNLRDGRLKVVQSLSPWPVSQSYRRASVVSILLSWDVCFQANSVKRTALGMAVPTHMPF